MKKLILILLCLLSFGCAGKSTELYNKVSEQEQAYNNLSQSKTVQILDTPYLGATLRELDSRSPELDRKAVLSQVGSFRDILQSLSSMFPSLTFQVSHEEQESTISSSSGKYKVFFEGSLKGLLDHIATSTGYGWQYNNNCITFSRVITKTLTVYAMPGKNTYENTITNRSKESGSASRGNGVGAMVTTADTSMQTAQTTATVWEYNTFEEVVLGVRALLSQIGTVSANSASGTITVRDYADRVSSVEEFIAKNNTRMSRQIAVSVQVWSLELNDSNEAGFNLQALFENSNFSLVTGSLSNLVTNSLSATIVSGKLKDSSATLKALKEWGNAAQISSGAGIVMSNQPLPVLAVKKHGYLAGVSTSTSEYGRTTELTPGEVTTGFAMTVIPNIQENREVILQYNINLSNLDSMKSFSSENVTIDLPQVSARSFSQQLNMKTGQTLVLAGFQQETQSTARALAILSGNSKGSRMKSLLIITIQVENADV